MTLFIRGFALGTLTAFTSMIGYNYVNDQRALQERKPTSDEFEDLRKLESSRNILRYGVPDQGPYVRYYSNFAVAYSQAKKTPIWVAERITSDNINGPGDRRHVKFKPDPTVPTMFSAANSDYLGSGWSRGHISPAGDNKHSQEAMKETFYLSNIVPQNLDNNAGFWNRLEMYCRELTEKYSSVQIFSGPLTLPTKTENGKKIVTYPLIGANDVTVPTHLYKLIIVEDEMTNPVAMGSFIVPNEPIGFEHPLTEYQVPLEDLEKKSGVIFTPKLDTSNIRNLCEVESCRLVNKEKFDLYFIGRRLNSANTREHLENVWNEFGEQNLKPDKWHEKVYKQKLEEFAQKEGDSIRGGQKG